MAIMLPACPELELETAPVKMAGAIAVPGQGSPVYRAPANFQGDDLSRPHDPPASLGNFWPQPK